MNPQWTTLLALLRDPAAMATLDEAGWDLVLRQAASAGLLARLGAQAQALGITAALPAPVWRHMQAMLSLAGQKRRAVHWELVHLARDLAGLAGPVLLLKGAAYAAADLAPAPGRLFSDIDLLVPKAQIDAAEAALMLGGWVSNAHSAYDQRYYREWMHELPPMSHIRRQTALDLHHNILPETARLRVRAEPLLAAARPLPGHPRFAIPAPADLVLHSATHLFHEGEWAHGLRDLVDLDALLRSGMTAESFWPELLARAAELGLGRPLFYGLRYSRRLIGTPVPEAVLRDCPDRPGALALRLMDALFLRAFSSAHGPSADRGTGLAAFALYVRSHYLRMPLRLLLPHLLSKAVQRRIEAFRASRKPDEPLAAGADTQTRAEPGP